MVHQTPSTTLYIDDAAASGRRISDKPPAPLSPIIPRAELLSRLALLFEASVERERAYRISGECPAYDPADFPGFTSEQIERDLITPICGISANAN